MDINHHLDGLIGETLVVFTFALSNEFAVHRDDVIISFSVDAVTPLWKVRIQGTEHAGAYHYLEVEGHTLNEVRSALHEQADERTRGNRT